MFVVLLFSDYIWYYYGLKCLHLNFELFPLLVFSVAIPFLFALVLLFLKLFLMTYHIFKKKYNKSVKSLVHILVMVLILIACIYSGKTNNPFHISFMRGFTDHIRNESFDIDEINVWLDSFNSKNLRILHHPSSAFPKDLASLPPCRIVVAETETNKRYVKLKYGITRFHYGFVFGASSEEVPNPIDNEYRVDLNTDGYIWIDLDKDRHL